MTSLQQIINFLRRFAPVELAEEWDNVGLLVGVKAGNVSRIMTCLTLTPDVAREAIEKQADLVVSHHPVMFRPIQRLTDESVEGTMLWEVIRHGIAVYSPHTGYDSAAEGINQQLATLLQLQEVAPLRPLPSAEDTPAEPRTAFGAGRYGRLPQPVTLGEFLQTVKQQLRIENLQYVGSLDARIEQVGIACGAAAEFLTDAHRLGCQLLLTGEARFHDCLHARGLGMAMVLPGHYASERPAMEVLAGILTGEFPELTVWASEAECDPVQWG